MEFDCFLNKFVILAVEFLNRSCFVSSWCEFHVMILVAFSLGQFLLKFLFFMTQY
uniref:Uncharacterized protein n=1 Tax=Rhizophora mucronata TaxID=61149 RepID=A0A2P2N411_RHIMU